VSIALTIIHVLACFGIIGIVLLQSGKGADIGSAFGGAGSQAVFGSMGTPTLPRQDHDGDRHRLHAHVVHARPARRRARQLCRARGRAAPGERAGAGTRAPRPRGPGDSSTGPAALTRMRRGDLFRLSGLLLLIALAGCGGEADSASDVAAGQAPGKPAYGDTYIEALQGNISGLIPNVLTDGPSFEVAGMIYNGLVKYDKDLNLVGELAESWQYSRDCLDLTFKLRPNVRWHDQKPFTAADVVFTYETMVIRKRPPRTAATSSRGVGAGGGSLHGARPLQAPQRQGAPELEHLDAPQAPARVVCARGQASRGAPESGESGGNRTVPLQGMEGRGKGRPGRQC
jgi:hypothetical protein